MTVLDRPAPGFVALVGNSRSGSRTARLAASALHTVTDLIAGRRTAERAVLDLADLRIAVGSPPGPDAADRYAGPLRLVRSARLLVVAAPRTDAGRTGLLTAFLHQLPAGALTGVVAVPVITGGPADARDAEEHLRPRLTELGAVCPTRPLAVGEDRLAEPARAVDSWLCSAAPTLLRWFGSTKPAPAC